jgi:NOL1/NOP2/fmu family ribosome biogenesis protein
MNLNIINYGIPIATRGRKNIIPDPTLAFSWEFNHTFPLLELDKEAALHYLTGEMPKTSNGFSRGYITVTYNHIPLGFVKNVGNRLNNLFPKSWRIRMQI